MRPIAFLFLIVFALPSLAQTTKSEWIADSKTGCKIWNSSPKPNETIAWSGDCKIGLAQGRGVLQWFLDGKRGDRYEGEYRGGQANGRGVYTYTDGSHYDGEWREGRRNGRGVFTFTNGNLYDGEFKDGNFNGRGVFTFADGNRYVGEFKDNKVNGTGILVVGGKTYSGSWTNGCYRQGDEIAVIGATRKECGFE